MLPEIPYEIENIAKIVNARNRNGKGFTIIAVAEGARSKEEMNMKKKDLTANPYRTAAHRVAEQVAQITGAECRAVVPGHIQRGGSPSSYDRVLSTRFGVHAAELIRDEKYGVTVALDGDTVTSNPLDKVAGITKLVPPDHQMVKTAKQIGISFGD